MSSGPGADAEARPSAEVLASGLVLRSGAGAGAGAEGSAAAAAGEEETGEGSGLRGSAPPG